MNVALMRTPAEGEAFGLFDDLVVDVRHLRGHHNVALWLFDRREAKCDVREAFSSPILPDKIKNVANKNLLTSKTQGVRAMPTTPSPLSSQSWRPGAHCG